MVVFVVAQAPPHLVTGEQRQEAERVFMQFGKARCSCSAFQRLLGIAFIGCVCLFVCVFIVCLFVFVCLCMFVCIGLCLCLFVCVCLCLFVCVCLWVQVYLFA